MGQNINLHTKCTLKHYKLKVQSANNNAYRTADSVDFQIFSDFIAFALLTY